MFIFAIYIFLHYICPILTHNNKNHMEKIIKWTMYTLTFPHNFIIGFIQGWKCA